jgi:hypothetical protein
MPTDFWTILLAVGVLAMFVTTVLTILGLTPGKKASKTEAISPLRVVTANAARERASAAARAKAAAAARERVHQLTDVRELPAGQTAAGVDDQRAQQPAVTPEEAEAILAHYAENDPNRLAEVIIQWIKSDVNNEAPRPS